MYVRFTQMSVVLGLILLAIIGYFLYAAARFSYTVLRHRQDNAYGRRMIYSLVAALVMLAAIVWL
jgi:hypothetical protein